MIYRKVEEAYTFEFSLQLLLDIYSIDIEEHFWTSSSHGRTDAVNLMDCKLKNKVIA